jgi:uncharacterized membrane protein (UPF0182 family)
MEDDRLIEIRSRRPRRRLLIALALAILILLFGSRLLGLYIDALWFESLGYGQVYWYKLRVGALIAVLFFALTFTLIRLPFALLERALPQLREPGRFLFLEDLRPANLPLMFYRPIVLSLSILVALIYAARMSEAWPEFALYFNSERAGITDPIFNRDVSFYLFALPVANLLSDWLVALALIVLIGMGATSLYVWYVAEERGFGRIGGKTLPLVSKAGSALALALAIRVYLNRYDLLNEQHQLYSGITYTDAHVRLPAMAALTAALILAAGLFLTRRRRPALLGMGAVMAAWLIGLVILPQAIYSLSVKPNELVKETPFIENNIKMTRQAFQIDRFQERPFEPSPQLTPDKIEANREMLDNIRLWDREALRATLGQLQEIRTYYEFRTPDVDRYLIGGRPRQVLIAAREMNVDQLPERSRTWINQHIVYTHGYGVTMCTANEFTPEGAPHFILKDMPVESQVPEIRVLRPEIYFGEATNAHIYVGARPQGNSLPEFNYPDPSGADSYTQYQGKAGLRVGGFLRKLALAIFLGDGTNLLFSDYITPESRLLMRRNVIERAQTIAPFLLLEEDPYIVISRDGRLFWIIDAFTFSNRYPYSTAQQMAGRQINYIRNSVKIVVDAYEGEVKFYVFEPDDLIIRTYKKIFPNMFLEAGAMPADLREHVRYPSLLVEAQAQTYELYHMRSAQTFYNREDLWQIARLEEPGQQDARPIRPYHAMMFLPGEQRERLEFVNIIPFVPAGPGRNNMIGWMAARSDGEHYGKALVFSFPKNITINGPAQIKARVNQDPQLSAQMTLWNQQGSRVLRGQLLAIPIADSLLYVEPFYLQAENSPMPELRQVAVATQDRLATGNTFDQALRALFAELPSTDQRARPPQRPQPTDETSELARQAASLLSDYERLTAEGKHREAGEKLDRLKQLLSDKMRK